ncbi:MAG: helix-turn-helix transcriptional regulator [Acholeplasmatales bacterium]|jgi:transcriptional regulator with XRE-family HTH domain|nr:helix-turn-helix transcriptional regulator [Acholeplasmatales bacterium]MCI9653018.1 helix-turn-helix transcriptional regulator [Acholeplasmatales bacterium]
MDQKQFIELVKRKRLSNLLSQKDLAKSIPISKVTYSKIENHQQNPNFFVIRRLAEILDIDLNIIKEEQSLIVFYD